MTMIHGQVNGVDRSTLPGPSTSAPVATEWAPEKIKELFTALEVPFHPIAIRWRVTNTSKNGSRLRGQVMPYADQRAYMDRLNLLVGPNGWTRKYEVHTSATFERAKDQKITAKVIVSCEVTIFGVGSHAATGEEWADNENAATAAEAQAFKRACACLGLGRYLYYFRGTWADLDERKLPRALPRLPEWATPEGWAKGLRPEAGDTSKPQNDSRAEHRTKPQRPSVNAAVAPLVREIESMRERLGNRVYRGLLKNLAGVWNPSDIRDAATQERVLKHMQSAERGFRRVEHLVTELGRGPVIAVLNSLKLTSLDQVADLETLKAIVLTLQAKLQPMK
jgi:hypothetical protein